jgi:hypothetical protein
LHEAAVIGAIGSRRQYPTTKDENTKSDFVLVAVCLRIDVLEVIIGYDAGSATAEYELIKIKGS